jgi:putative addiction module CopG family antidote
MTKLEISLSDAASQFLDEQVASGRFRSPGEVVADLVERAKVQAARERLADLILEGENSGEGVEFTRESWERRTAELVAEAERRRRP